MTLMTLARRQGIDLAAERGALFLDMKNPGWYQHVDLRLLAISTNDHCILGQLFGSYLDGLNGLDLMDGQALELGFLLAHIGGYMVLNTAWRKEIRARRDEAKVSAVEPRTA